MKREGERESGAHMVKREKNIMHLLRVSRCQQIEPVYIFRYDGPQCY